MEAFKQTESYRIQEPKTKLASTKNPTGSPVVHEESPKMRRVHVATDRLIPLLHSVKFTVRPWLHVKNSIFSQLFGQCFVFYFKHLIFSSRAQFCKICKKNFLIVVLRDSGIVDWQRIRRGRKLQFSAADSCKFPTEEIMGAQNFKLPLSFPKMGVLAQILHFWPKFSDKKEISRQLFDSPKFRGFHLLPPATTPLLCNFEHKIHAKKFWKCSLFYT